MRQSKNLGSLRVQTVYEHKRGILISQSESPELFWIKFSPVITSHNAAYHNKDTRILGMRDKFSQGFGPGRAGSLHFQIESQSFPHCCRCLLNRGLDIHRAYKPSWFFRNRPREISIPSLAALTKMEDIKQIGTGRYGHSAAHNS